MTVLVTGATGFVGGQLVRALLERGEDVRVYLRGSEGNLSGVLSEVTPFYGDIRDGPRVEEACRGVDRVFHLAAKISIEGSQNGQVEQVNVGGANNVVRACLRTGVSRLVHMSSIHALEPDPIDEPVDETRALTSKTAAYDRSKALAEASVQSGVARGLDAVVVNPVAVIGPGDGGPSLTGQMILAMMNEKLPGVVARGFHWVDVRDVVDGALLAMERGVSGNRYLLSGEFAQTRTIAELVAEASGVRPPWFTSPLWLAYVGVPFMAIWSRVSKGRPMYTMEALDTLRRYQQVVSSKASDELGYAPRPLRQTIRATVDWFRRSGMA